MLVMETSYSLCSRRIYGSVRHGIWRNRILYRWLGSVDTNVRYDGLERWLATRRLTVDRGAITRTIIITIIINIRALLRLIDT
jgi:hypothetical protein